MPKYVVAHYHEVALKGKNRPMFVDRVLVNIRRALRDCGLRRASALQNRVVVEIEDDAPWEEVSAGLRRVFGLVNFALAERTALEMDAIKAAVHRAIEGRQFNSFKIEARRSDKRFPLTSEQLNRELGAYVQSLVGTPVNLSQPDFTVHVTILSNEALVYGDKFPGPGGLPVGSGGRVATLLSGGIDSPVAAWRMMRRGCTVVFVHFHSHPFLDASSKQKAQELVELLDPFQGNSRLYLVPFGESQRQVVLNAPAPYRTVIYRRLMVRIAGRIARVEHAQALVTGESLGQVASQTLENIAAIESAAELPILRPLVAMDKLEIIQQAEGIGTFAVSILPDQDCCQLFMPRSPITRASDADLRKAEEHLDMEHLVNLALEELEVVQYRREGRRKERRSLGDDVAERPMERVSGEPTPANP